MREKIIDYNRLNIVIMAYMELEKKFNLDQDELKLVLDILVDRRQQKLNQMRMADMTNNVPVAGLIKKIMGKAKGEQDALD